MLISESYPREFDLVGLSGLGNGHSKKPLYVKLILKFDITFKIETAAAAKSLQ